MCLCALHALAHVPHMRAFMTGAPNWNYLASATVSGGKGEVAHVQSTITLVPVITFFDPDPRWYIMSDDYSWKLACRVSGQGSS